MDAAPPGYRTVIGATSLIVGPALMSVGDLFHPAETHAAPGQVAILAQSASRWYAAHLLLFVGMLLLVPGILALGEIILAKVLLSQIGNILIFVAGIAFARLLLRGREGAPVKP
jgi:hypothetical protein